MDYKCRLNVMIQVHTHNRYLFMHYVLVLIAHLFDQLAYALASYAPHAFTLVLLELVASAFFMQATIFNKCTYEPACQ